MTSPTLLVPLLVLLLAVAVIYSIRRSRGHRSRTFDLGVVSTRWLAELRRDDPWTRS